MVLRRDPLLLPAIAFALGVALSPWLGVPLWHASIAAGVVLAAVLYSRYRRWYAVAMFLFLGIAAETGLRPGAAPELDALPGETVILSGCVVEPPAFSEGREQFVLEIAQGARARVSKYLRDTEAAPQLFYGQRVEVEARVRKPRNFGNPGSFDLRGYLARRQIFWTASVSAGSPVRVVDGSCGNRLAGWIFGLRTSALDRIASLYDGNAYAIGMLQAMLVGDMVRLERVWADDFRRTGTYHAIVISGLHITMIVWVLLKVLRLLSLHRTWVSWLAVPLIWIYAGMCGWQAPVVRAAGGFTLFSIGRFFFRESRILNLLGVLALLFLALDPQQMDEASFHLTFLAVLALGALAIPAAEATTAPLLAGLRDLTETSKDMHLPPRVAQFRIELRLIAEAGKLWLRIPMAASLWAARIVATVVFWTWETMLISGAVQLGLALPMVIYFHRLSFSGLSANLIVTPLLTMAVPIGLLAIATSWSVPVKVTALFVEWAREVTRWHAALEPNWRVPDPPLWLAGCFVASLIALAATRRRLLIVPTLGLLAVILIHPFEPQRVAGELELTMIDVGQGEALLVGLPDGRWMLVDGGGIPVFGKRTVKPRLDIGEDVVTPYLLQRSIRRVDVIVSTHQHDDHAGGLPALMANFRPRELWTGAMPESAISTVLLAKAKELGIRVRHMQRPETIPMGAVRIEVLSPSAEYVARAAPSNNDSLVLRLHYGQHNFLLTGDMERAMEQGLIDSVADTQVLKIAHHGSKTSTSDAFLDQARPLFALISAGKDNMFRHPHPDVTGRLAAHHTATLRTDEWGLITIRSDGKRFQLEAQRWRKQGWSAPQPF